MAEPQSLSVVHHCDNYSRETTKEEGFIMARGFRASVYVLCSMCYGPMERWSIMTDVEGQSCSPDGRWKEGRRGEGGREGGRVRNKTLAPKIGSQGPTSSHCVPHPVSSSSHSASNYDFISGCIPVWLRSLMIS